MCAHTASLRVMAKHMGAMDSFEEEGRDCESV